MKKNLILIAVMFCLIVLTVVITVDLVQSRERPAPQQAEEKKDGEIFELIKRGDVEGLRALLKAHPEAANARDQFGNLPLDLAVKLNRPDMVRLLQQQGGVPEKQRLEDAAIVEAKRALQGAGGGGGGGQNFGGGQAQQPVAPQQGEAPVGGVKHNLVLHGAVGIFDVIKRDDMEGLRALLESRPEAVNERDQLQDSPLHHAVGRNRADMVDLLISYKSDIQARNVQGETPLHTAAGAGLTDMVRLLIHHGADVNIKDGRLGLTPLTWALLFGRRETAEFLKQRGGK